MTRNPTLDRQIDAINRHDAKAFAACYSADTTVFDPQYPELLRGREAIAKDMSDFLAAFPDLQATVRQSLDNGDIYAFEIRMTGTHEGPMAGPGGAHIPATKRRIDIGGCIMARVGADGTIVEERRYYDLAGLLGQLGLMQ
jgi:steroid delta-isomerase-like uncharacterized protein